MSRDIIYYKDKLEEFENRWEDFVRCNNLPYPYLPSFIDYQMNYSKFIVENESFLVVQNQKTIAIAFIPIESYSEGHYISISKGYTFAPIVNSIKGEAFVFDEIKKISAIYKINKIMFYYSPLSTITTIYNPLIKYGFLDTSSSNGILPIAGENRIWKRFSKGHKSAIKGILKNSSYKITIVDSSNCFYGVSEKYRELHQKSAGRITRSKETFEHQYKLVEQGCSFYSILTYNDDIVAVCYFIISGTTAVYQSAVKEPNFASIPIYHALIWEAIKYLSKKGVTLLEVQPPCGYSVQLDDYIDSKQLNISRFKRGFGVNVVPMFRGIKYFKKQLFLDDVDLFKQRYSESINEWE